ncbi:MAG TPA: DNA polymerase Y family protein [Xanthomonadaceae bacterium]|nr:DNA polymerase Y family protein [Xanthomonadaceae bacterium]
MLYACIHLPELAFEALSLADGEIRPQVLLGAEASDRVLLGCDAAAGARGLRPGQSLAAAQALCPDLVLRRRDAAAERRRRDLLAAWAYGFTSQVAVPDGQALLLEVGASLKLFGGWPRLERRLRHDLALLGHAHRIVVAPVARAARVLACRHDGLAVLAREPMQVALGQLPLAGSGLPGDTVAALARMGLRHLRELFRLPRAELARRIGAAALAHLDRLRGEAAEPFEIYRPAERFGQRLELAGAVASVEALLFPLQRLCRELALFLSARDGGVERYTLHLEHEDHAPTRVRVGLRSAQRDPAALLEFARGRLERAVIAAPVVALALEAVELPPFRPELRDLFTPVHGQGLDWPALAERLRARLGDEAVHDLGAVAEHRPEYAAARAATATDAVERRPRPLWLLERPIPLRARSVRVLGGPERIESGWWDGGEVRRDYYMVELDTGQRAWAWRAPGSDGWMLHGWFA